MDTKTTLVITGFVAAAVIGAATMVAQPVYAPGGTCVGCGAEFAPWPTSENSWPASLHLCAWTACCRERTASMFAV
jgi:hypothetical protein